MTAPLPRARGMTSGRGPANIVLRTTSQSMFATRSAIRFNPPIRACYTRLRAAGKLERVAAVACLRKLLTMLSAMLRANTDWDPQHFQPTTTAAPA